MGDVVMKRDRWLLVLTGVVVLAAGCVPQATRSEVVVTTTPPPIPTALPSDTPEPTSTATVSPVPEGQAIPLPELPTLEPINLTEYVQTLGPPNELGTPGTLPPPVNPTVVFLPPPLDAGVSGPPGALPPSAPGTPSGDEENRPVIHRDEPAPADLLTWDDPRYVAATGRPQLLVFQTPGCTACLASLPPIVAEETVYWGRIDFLYIDRDDPDNIAVVSTYSMQQGAIPTLILIDANGYEDSRWTRIVQREIHQRLKNYLTYGFGVRLPELPPPVTYPPSATPSPTPTAD